jgi:hypothetical protein
MHALSSQGVHVPTPSRPRDPSGRALPALVPHDCAPVAACLDCRALSKVTSCHNETHERGKKLGEASIFGFIAPKPL